MGTVKFFAAVIILAAMSFYGCYLYISGELEYLKIYVPAVDNLASYNEEIKLSVYGADDLEMFSRYFRRSRRLPDEYNMSRLIFIADRLLENKHIKINNK